MTPEQRIIAGTCEIKRIAALPSAGSFLFASANEEGRDRDECSRVYERSPLWVISGHTDKSAPCPLCPEKRTFVRGLSMSALCQ